MDKVSRAATNASDRLTSDLQSSEPLFCECARTGKRALSWARWIPGLSSNPVSGWANKEFAHEHIIFDQSGDNIGFGPHGLFSEDHKSMSYHLDGECYDGSVMRAAIEQTKPPGAYLFFIQNCQTYVERVRDAYNRLKR